MKKGDILYAIDRCVIEDDHNFLGFPLKTLTINKEYEVIKVYKTKFCIIDDTNENHEFDIVDFDKYFSYEKIQKSNFVKDMNKETVWYLLFCNVFPIILIMSGITLALCKISGWGWLFGMAYLSYVSPHKLNIK